MRKIKRLLALLLTVTTVFFTVQVVYAESNNTASDVSSSDVTSLAKAKEYKLSKTSYYYSGKSHKPTVTVIDTNGNKIEPSNYILKYFNNKNPGIASVNIIYKAPYSGCKKLNFTIKLKTPKKPELVQIKQKQFMVNLTESTGVSGYEIKYSTSSKFKKAKTIKLSKTKGLQYSVTGLNNDQKYYVKVRSYKSVDGKNKYSSWSKAASIKVTSRAPQADLPTEMLESYVLDSMEYIGYNVKRQKKNGTILQDRASGPRTPMKDRSGIVYGGGPSGIETVKDKTTVSGKAPNLKKFRSQGMCCASFVSYYYLNYLPNIAGVDTSYIKKAMKKSGHGYQTCDAWYAAAKSLVKQGKAVVVDKVTNGRSLAGADLDKLEIGDLLTFSIPNQGLACGHVAVYAGTNNGEHFVAHVGSDEGPVFQTLQRFENVVNAHDGCAYSTVYRFKNLPTSKYDYSVKLSKTKYKYNGKAIKPTVTVKDATGKKISESDYTVYYTNNNAVGTAKVTVVFKGKYKGTKTAKFKITK